MDDISITTASAKSGKGVTVVMGMRLEGNLFIWLVLSGILSILTLMICYSVLKINWFLSAILACQPVFITGIYLKMFYINKPPEFKRDYFDQHFPDGFLVTLFMRLCQPDKARLVIVPGAWQIKPTRSKHPYYRGDVENGKKI